MYCSDYMFESISVKLPVSCLCCNLKSTKINFLSESRRRRASALKQMVGEDDKNNLGPAGVLLDEFPHAENIGKPSCCHGVSISGWKHKKISTLPATNIAPEKKQHPKKERFIFQPLIFCGFCR